jgi:hypothetical protein
MLYRIHRIFLDFSHRPVFQKTRRFGNWICFRPQVKVGEKTPTQLGPLERANLNHWTNPGPWKTPYTRQPISSVRDRNKITIEDMIEICAKHALVSVILFLSLTDEIGCRVFIRCFPRTGGLSSD